MFSQYRRNNQPYLIFHHAQNENLDALWLLANMGEKAIHVVSVYAVVSVKVDESHELAVTQFTRVNVLEQNA